MSVRRDVASGKGREKNVPPRDGTAGPPRMNMQKVAQYTFVMQSINGDTDMKRAMTLTGAMILAMAVNALPIAAQDRGPMPRGPQFEFADLDADNDGKVTPEELQAHAAARFAAADTDGNGTLSVEELIARQEVLRTERMQRGAERMIERMDQNGDGVLSADEMGPRNGDRLFARLDADDDGAISEEEMTKARERFADRHDGKGGKWMKRHDDGDHGHGQKWRQNDN